nr:flagellar hook-length control protein FliK [Sphingobium subterraneum]
MATVTPSPTQSAEPPVPQPSGPPPQKSTRPAGVSAGKAVGPQVPPPATDASPAPPGNAEPSVSFPLANRPVERLAAETPTPVISARPSHIGRELGVEIARHIGQDEHDTLTVRLDPAHHGRIEVRMQFDDTGQLRATLTATNPATLDMLRRDSAELTRALGDAGINADAGSFRFDSAPGRGENPHASDRRDRPPRFSDPEPPPPSGPISRSIMDGGRVNLVA